MEIALGALIGYAIGAIPFGYVLPRLAKGIDIRTVGSGNIGATNVGRVLGRWWGIAVFVLDAGKGFSPAFFLAPLVAHGASLVPAQVAAGLGAILGHMFPVYLGFKGGKGVATSAGVFLGLAPLPAACALGAWAVVLALTRYVSLASIVGAVVLPSAMIALDRAHWLGKGVSVFGLCVLASILVIVRHRANLGRLAAGTEPKVGAKKKEEVPSA